MTAQIRRRHSNRPETILDAADDVLRRNGPREMTIEAVASQARLSKGGVLHHYASKDVLIRALVDRKLEELRQGVESYTTERATDVMSPTISLVKHLRRSYAEKAEFSRALLVASIDNPSALEGYRSFVAEGLATKHADDGYPSRHAIVFLAVIGLLLGRALRLHDVSGEQADTLFDALERLAQDS